MDTGIDNVVFEPESDDDMVQCSSGDEAETVDAELFFDAADGDVEAGSDSDILCQETHPESPDILSDDSESGAKTMLAPMPPWGAYPCRPALSRGGVSTLSDVVSLDYTVERLLRKLGASRAASLGGTSIRSVCLCAGTGCTNSILEAVARGVKAQAGVGISHVTVFYCEIQGFKQRFIRAHHGGNALIFKDVVALSSDTGDAADSHGSRQQVPLDVDWVFCGPSCKDISTLNGKRKHLGTVIEGRTGSSGTTFAGAVAYLEKSQAKVATLEMVLALLTQRSHSVGECETSNCSAWGNALRSAGFEFSFVTAVSSDFFVPQARCRVYTVAASPKRCRLPAHEVRARLERVKSSVESLADPRLMKPLACFWISHEHPAVQKEIRRLQQSLAKETPPRHRGGERPKWIDDHQATFEKCGHPWVEPVLHETTCGDCRYRPAMEKNNPFYASLSDRNKHMLELLWRRYGDPPMVEVPWDLHESLSWLVPHLDAQVTRGELLVRTITPAAKLWCAFLRPQRPALGLEKMYLQGLPCDEAYRFTDGQLSNLAGNGFAAPVVAAIALCMLLEFSDVMPHSRAIAGIGS